MAPLTSFPPAPKKSLGQNFLRDKRIIQHIISAAELEPEDHVLEIGPGDGCLTRELLKSAKQVTAIEIDQRMIAYLEPQLAGFNNLSLIQADALRYDYEKLFTKHLSFKLVANLPYYIATPLIQHFISLHKFFSSLILMLPSDVAKRLMAKPGIKDYGFFSILVQFYYQIKTVCRAPAQAFYPQPKVDSLVLKLTPWETLPVTIQDENFYWQLIKAAFAQRRKTLLNSLQHGLPYDKKALLLAIQRAGIDPKIRAERLNAEDFAHLADNLKENHCK